jgi:hypothetical protein
MSDLAEKVVIITGASSGIGEATARAVAAEGAQVVLAARRLGRLERIAADIAGAGGSAIAVACDVTERAAVRKLIDTAVERFGRIDVLINNAGVMPLAPLAQCRLDEWDQMIDINIKGMLYGIGFVLPIMLSQKSGHIVNVSSVAGRRLFPNGAVYCGTKHAVHAISEGLRGELAEQGMTDGNRIRVTVIAPGVVETELQETINDDRTRAGMAAYAMMIGEPLSSDDVARSIVFALQSPEHVSFNELLMRPTRQPR